MEAKNENPKANHPSARKAEATPEAPTDDATVKGDVAEKVEAADEAGFYGEKVDPRPNSDYSLESGPDCPPAVEGPDVRADQYVVVSDETP